MKFAISRKGHVNYYFAAVFCIILIAAFLISCGEDEEDEFINPQNTIIGSQGGTAPSADGNATVEIPPGAVSSNTTITVGESSSTPPGTIGKAYSFAPEGFQFSKPVTICLKYNPDSVPVGVRDSDLAMGRESGGEWQEVSSYMVDSPNRTVSGSVTGFSSYGIFCPNAPSTSAEYWDMVNEQVCRVLDATREMNTGMLLIYRGYESDFRQECDPDRTEYSDQEADWIMAGLQHTAESLVILEEELQQLKELEETANGFQAPGRANARGSFIAETLIEWKLGDFGKKLMGVSEELKFKLMVYVGMVISDMDLAPYYCRRACTLNRLFRYSFDEGFSKENGSELCEEDKDMLRAEAFDIIDWHFNDEKQWPSVLRLSREIGGCVDMADWGVTVKEFAANQAAELTEAGGKFYWDTIKEVVAKGEYNDQVDAMEDTYQLMVDAFSGMAPRRLKMAPASGVVQPADAVVYFVPQDLVNLPVLVTATVADENGVMEIQGANIGTYELIFYSSGNYPVVMDNVVISPANTSVEIPDPQPLEGISAPSFPAFTTGDPTTGLDPVMPACPLCDVGASYSVTHTAKASGESNTPNMGGRYEFTTEASFDFDFEGGEAVIQVPYIVQKTFTNNVDEFGGVLIYRPSLFRLQGVAEWHIRKENRDGQTCYTANVSILEEETKHYVVSYQDAGGNVVVINEQADVTTWGGFNAFPHGELDCGELPIEYNRKWQDAVGPVGGEEDVTVIIEEQKEQ